MSELLIIEEEIDRFINCIQPLQQSNETRKNIFLFLKTIAEKRLSNVLLAATGSTCSRTYLPDGDLDLVLLSNGDNSESNRSADLVHLNKLFGVLCDEINEKDQGISSYLQFTIRNVELINARTKLLHCKVNNIGVDVSFQQTGAIYTLHLMEEVNSFIGNQSLFKRSIILVKVSVFSSYLRCTHVLCRPGA